MTRNRQSAKKAGTQHESDVAAYLRQHIDDRIERRARNGEKDRGDVGGVRLSPALRGGRVVIEAKNTTRTDLAEWAKEAERERGHDDAVAAVTVHKRNRNANPGDQWVTCTLADFVALLTGERPEEDSYDHHGNVP